MGVRCYSRPLALLWGPDARRAVESRQAGWLGGSDFVAFGQAELVERGDSIDRRVVPYADLPEKLKRPIEMPRANLAGVELNRPRLMGIVNVTPDSFSDGGLHAETASAIAHGKLLHKEGADFLDVGGESTRPGSHPISIEREKGRVVDVIANLSRAGAIVSVDTRKPEVMMAAAAAGAAIVNDVSALTFDDRSVQTVAHLGLPVVLMHAQGTPETMQANPAYDDVALDVYDALEARIAVCIAGGINRDRLVIDPGIGFGKTSQHNIQLLQQLTLFHGLGLPLLVGLSRKGFTGHLTGEPEPRNRVHGSTAGAAHAALHGAHVIRVHDVKATRQALAVALAAVDPGKPML